MKKYYVLKDLSTGLFFYGWYSSKDWTDDIKEAAFYTDKETISNELYFDRFKNKYIEIIEVWKQQ